MILRLGGSFLSAKAFTIICFFYPHKTINNKSGNKAYFREFYFLSICHRSWRVIPPGAVKLSRSDNQMISVIRFTSNNLKDNKKDHSKVIAMRLYITRIQLYDQLIALRPFSHVGVGKYVGRIKHSLLHSDCSLTL